MNIPRFTGTGSGRMESIRMRSGFMKTSFYFLSFPERPFASTSHRVSTDFQFLSTDWKNIFTIQETSGTSGTPKSFFLTWDDWKRYAEKYARSFVSQGFGPEDRVVVCASYGMNVGANTMTLAAQRLGMTIIPFGKCDFSSRVISGYRPTAIVGSVFKLLRLYRRLEHEGVKPEESSIVRLVAGGESFADESRAYLAETWGCPVYNTYGSTEGTMCGECSELAGLHVPEDLCTP